MYYLRNSFGRTGSGYIELTRLFVFGNLKRKNSLKSVCKVLRKQTSIIIKKQNGFQITFLG